LWFAGDAVSGPLLAVGTLVAAVLHRAIFLIPEKDLLVTEPPARFNTLIEGIFAIAPPLYHD